MAGRILLLARCSCCVSAASCRTSCRTIAFTSTATIDATDAPEERATAAIAITARQESTTGPFLRGLHQLTVPAAAGVLDAATTITIVWVWVWGCSFVDVHEIKLLLFHATGSSIYTLAKYRMVDIRIAAAAIAEAAAIYERSAAAILQGIDTRMYTVISITII